MTETVPTIETERLYLRAFEHRDFEAMFGLLSDPIVMRMIGGGQPLEREEAWRRLLGARGIWALMNIGYWVIERKSDGAVIGQAGFGDFYRDIVPSIAGALEIGWMLSSHAFGMGYATEAAGGCLRWAARTFPGRRVVAIIDPGNAASIRVAEKLGEWTRAEASYRGSTVVLLTLVRGLD